MRNYCDVSYVLRDSASSNPTILYRAHCITHASWNLLRAEWISNDKIIFSDESRFSSENVSVIFYRSRSERYNTEYVATSTSIHLWRLRH